MDIIEKLNDPGKYPFAYVDAIAEIKRLRQQLGEAQSLLAIYHDSLIKLDECSLALGKTISLTRIGWDDDATCEGVLGPLNQIAKQISEAMPPSIVATRPKPVLWRPITGEIDPLPEPPQETK